MNTRKHPEPELLMAYQQNPEAEQYAHIALHLAQCSQCRHQLSTSARLKELYPAIDSTHISAAQQQVVDELLYGDISNPALEKNRDSIRNNPLMLKSALHSLSAKYEAQDNLQQLQPEKPQPVKDHKPDPVQGWLGRMTDYIKVNSNTWLTASITAVVTLTVTLFMMPGGDLVNPVTNDGSSVTIASYQDDGQIRFMPRQSMPGIGFFSAAKHGSKPYDNIHIHYVAEDELLIKWAAVQNASAYELTLYRYSQGEKKLLHKEKTVHTSTRVQLKPRPFNQRYEWVLSGTTTDDQSFITSGGFIIQLEAPQKGLL